MVNVFQNVVPIDTNRLLADTDNTVQAYDAAGRTVLLKGQENEVVSWDAGGGLILTPNASPDSSINIGTWTGTEEGEWWTYPNHGEEAPYASYNTVLQMCYIRGTYVGLSTELGITTSYVEVPIGRLKYPVAINIHGQLRTATTANETSGNIQAAPGWGIHVNTNIIYVYVRTLSPYTILDFNCTLPIIVS